MPKAILSELLVATGAYSNHRISERREFGFSETENFEKSECNKVKLGR